MAAPHVDVPLGSDFVDVVEKMQDDEPVPPAHTDDVFSFSSQIASRAPSSSRYAPPLGDAIVPLARVHKLEA